ncbi:MAG: tRNA-guanine transglycosylase, partial [Acidobacteria bacterium]|nr:tRNA-guanine transglycosylase [Acidobacteriota bacterium]
MTDFRLEVLKQDCGSGARRGRMQTRHGPVDTPAFMPVGTAGSVKGMTQQMLKELGAQIILANTYHLYLRPGHELIGELGGLHRFMSWQGAILTDSGGYQIFSQHELRKVSVEGVQFRSHLDGSPHLLTPEKAMEIQVRLGSDIVMALDEVPSYPSSPEETRASTELTLCWAKRCWRRFLELEHPINPGQVLFGIVPGGVSRELSKRCAEALAILGFAGYAVGGLS